PRPVRYAACTHGLFCAIGPPAPPLRSQMPLFFETVVTPWARSSSERLLLWSELLVPLATRMPEYLLPPSFGMTLIVTPLVSVVTDWAPISRLISWVAAGLKKTDWAPPPPVLTGLAFTLLVRMPL